MQFTNAEPAEGHSVRLCLSFNNGHHKVTFLYHVCCVDGSIISPRLLSSQFLCSIEIKDC